MLVFAHRGYHKDAPENTLEAFRHPKDRGADGIETDVRIDRAGIPILYHDRRAASGELVCRLYVEALSGILNPADR